MFEMIAFDADDTLWHNITLFTMTHDKFKALLADYHDSDWIERQLDDTQIRNLRIFGYGVKGYILSMIETAIQLTEGRIRGDQIQTIIDYGKEMLNTPVKLIDGVTDTLTRLFPDYPLMVITKGDLFDQQSRIAESGLAEWFQHVEVVAEKTPETYRRILERIGVAPERFLMVGNSLKSDVLPLLELGARAIHIPHDETWIHETVAPELLARYQYITLAGIAELPAQLRDWQ